MKVVILCGGKGTRLGEVTGNLIPKPMAEVGGEPILVHIMRYYASFGHREFILCAGHLSWAIKSYFLNFHSRHADVTLSTAHPAQVSFSGGDVADDWDVTIAETGNETATAGRLRKIMPYLNAGERFFLTYGDGLSDVDLDALLDFHMTHGRLATMSGVVPPGRFGEIVLDGDRIAEWAEKPVVSDRFINGGFFVFEPEFLDRFIANSPDNIMLEREPLAAATEAGELMLYRHDGFWQCMDTMRDWELLNDLYRAGKAPWCMA